MTLSRPKPTSAMLSARRPDHYGDNGLDTVVDHGRDHQSQRDAPPPFGVQVRKTHLRLDEVASATSRGRANCA